MPIFEYLCEDCGSKFEKLVRRSASESDANGVHCPSCGQEHLKQQFSTFSARANGASHTSQDAMPSCPSGMCRTPDLCGRN
ncbi:MAG TPA: zinc ribbon domain-containing protein [Bryobacteraceae bacterium]|jgi:putative FmdB family regulatory protein|nr:zinc ribbon domain-containing protein [Bryobacteraceae bacterium]